MTRVEHFAGSTESPAMARSLIRSELADCADEIVDAAELLISELVTNAVVHGAGTIDVELQRNADVVRAAVTDQGVGQPVPNIAQKRDLQGRGLFLVQSLARDWGVIENETGKSVWFALRVANPKSSLE